MEPVKKCASYADLCELPERFIAEIVEGDLYATPRPGFPVVLATSVLLGMLGAFHHRDPDGWILLHKVEVHFGDDVLVPDLAGWRRERLPTVPAADYMTLAPDWVCEVLSPITEQLDRGKKLQRYLREGVAHGGSWIRLGGPSKFLRSPARGGCCKATMRARRFYAPHRSIRSS